LFVIENNHRAHQIRTVIVAASVRAMAGSALHNKLLLTALHGIGRRDRPAD